MYLNSRYGGWGRNLWHDVSSGTITIQWTGGGTLESAPGLAAPITWTTTGNSSGSFSEPATGTKYYRVKR